MERKDFEKAKIIISQIERIKDIEDSISHNNAVKNIEDFQDLLSNEINNEIEDILLDYFDKRIEGLEKELEML